MFVQDHHSLKELRRLTKALRLETGTRLEAGTQLGHLNAKTHSV